MSQFPGEQEQGCQYQCYLTCYVWFGHSLFITYEKMSQYPLNDLNDIVAVSLESLESLDQCLLV